MKLVPQQALRSSSSVIHAAGRRTSIPAFLAVCGFLSSACGGNVAANGPPDASSGGDGRGATTADGSSDDPTVSTDAYSGPCMISASSYDQSCAVDTDCTTVTSTDYCAVNCLCGGSTISVGALSQFNEDVSKTPLGSGALGGAPCGCPSGSGPCCRHGICQLGGACSSPPDTLPACADAGGTCILGFIGLTCAPEGPPDACAYSDETCCLN
jgi:hypothetical protein